MGLDMYLTARLHVYDMTGDIKIEKNNEPYFECDMSIVSSIELQVAYWRKANQIHNWFVKNIQEDVDDCGTYYASREKLDELLKICKRVLETKNSDELPPCWGFFFGSTDIDQWYWEDITATIEQIEAALENPLFNHCSFYYHSSW